MKGLLKVTIILSAIILSGCGNDTDIDEDLIADVEPTGPEEIFSVLTLNVDGLPKAINIKEITATIADSVSWTASYGKYNHAWDAIVTKGFRRYDVKLAEGSEVVIYNMHMDAGDDQDEAKGLDGPDCSARMVQWRQLRDYILKHLDKRPVITVRWLSRSRLGIKPDKPLCVTGGKWYFCQTNHLL